MTKFRFVLRRLILPLLLLLSVNVSALSISAFKREADGEASITFCNALTVKNVAVEDKGFGPVLVFPADLGGYKNISVNSKEVDAKIKQCFISCKVQPSCAGGLNFKITNTHLFKTKKGIVATVNFGGALNLVFLVSKYKREAKDIFRIKYPQDLTITNQKLKADLKAALTKEAKKLL